MKKTLLLGLFLFAVSCANKDFSKLANTDLVTENPGNLINLNRSLEGNLIETGSTDRKNYYIATTDNQKYLLKNQDENLLKLKGSEIYYFEGQITGKESALKSDGSEEKTIFIEKALKRDKISLNKMIHHIKDDLYSVRINSNNQIVEIFFYKNLKYNLNAVYNILGNILYENNSFKIANPEISETNLIYIKEYIRSIAYDINKFNLLGHWINDIQDNYYPIGLGNCYYVNNYIGQEKPTSVILEKPEKAEYLPINNTDSLQKLQTCNNFKCASSIPYHFILKPLEITESIAFEGIIGKAPGTTKSQTWSFNLNKVEIIEMWRD